MTLKQKRFLSPFVETEISKQILKLNFSMGGSPVYLLHISPLQG